MEDQISKEEIAMGLEKLGLRIGDKVMVHSSLKSIGFVKGGAETLIDALTEAVGVIRVPLSKKVVCVRYYVQ